MVEASQCPNCGAELSSSNTTVKNSSDTVLEESDAIDVLVSGSGSTHLFTVECNECGWSTGITVSIMSHE